MGWSGAKAGGSKNVLLCCVVAVLLTKQSYFPVFRSVSSATHESSRAWPRGGVKTEKMSKLLFEHFPNRFVIFFVVEMKERKKP